MLKDIPSLKSLPTVLYSFSSFFVVNFRAVVSIPFVLDQDHDHSWLMHGTSIYLPCMSRFSVITKLLPLMFSFYGESYL